MAAKSIHGSVGQGASNFAPDVMTVQYLLNCVPTTAGGPAKELAVDGAIGPLTIAAIHGFQRAQLGWSDGRIDPESKGGKTISLLNEFDPEPAGELPAPESPTSSKGAAPGPAGAGAPPLPFAATGAKGATPAFGASGKSGDADSAGGAKWASSPSFPGGKTGAGGKGGGGGFGGGSGAKWSSTGGKWSGGSGGKSGF
jgi:hypothetical protein